ncbi:phospholipase D-like domain-containing protein [Halopseudomonas salegens]|uniref:Phosphatidylserine/phosphatidylglycerophosphate/cardiolipin synthase n=1 Tax=Halopseudomonas salegens TaxID=1434072 RepID=A0A1H2FWR5_9GAMM|nr:phosphatidylserine/phosphatidylglycerophosphate/cardiolipin synthase family protein [Halopseudomonas salegens]SDU11743.1 Phosphatidylserine/phosphatidylglycerophosphate/cardiolipin synthase [Halopseudomonas salegens]
MAGPIYPWHGANRFSLLIDGGAFMPRILQCMAGARHSIDLEFYLVSSGATSAAVIQVLVAAAGRGVQVRCLLDGFGSAQLDQAERDQLQAAGIQLRFYNPLRWLGGRGNLHRDHRKLVLVDAQEAFVGGAGLTDDFYQPEQLNTYWHEIMLDVQGPVVADWLDLFERQWRLCGRRLRWQPPRLKKVRVPPPPVSGEPTGYGRVSYTDASEHREIMQALLAAISRTEQRLWLATPYFLPSWQVRRALKRAARRGVDVRLLLCGSITDNPAVRYAGQRFYRGLLKTGVRIFEYQPRFLHLKMVLADDWVSIGSCNFDHWNMHWNLEANQQALDRSLTTAVVASFSQDFAQCKEWTYAEWRRLPLWHRAKIGLWGRLNRLAMLWFNIRG